jgi:hypothetical protein
MQKRNLFIPISLMMIIILGSLTYLTATTIILVPNKAMAQATASLPDDECLFEPSLPKCAPGQDGKCPSGFNMNGDGNCFPNKPCPPGYEKRDYDETGKCWEIELPTSTNSSTNATLPPPSQ